MAFENTYTSILAGESNATVSGNTLTLTSPRGRLTFAR
jgi:heat shock protein HslJ